MIENERSERENRAIETARRMMTAARTAPKAKGTDIVEIAMIAGDDLNRLSDEMARTGAEENRPGMIRDAGCISRCQAVVIIGVKLTPMGLNCGHCGFGKCALKPCEIPCAFNAIDTGIAIGSACATAADLRVDTRVMYSAGIVAQRLGWLPDCSLVQAIPVSISSKSPFFDRG